MAQTDRERVVNLLRGGHSLGDISNLLNVDASTVLGIITAGTGSLGGSTGGGPVVPPVVTALPSNPTDGQECYFRPVTNTADPNYPVLWHLRYNLSSPSAYKWEVIEGAPLHLENSGSVTIPGSQNTSYGDLGGASQPSFTTPVGGDWEIETGAESWNNATANEFTLIAPSVAGVATASNGVQSQVQTQMTVPSRIARVTGVASGSVIKQQYKVGAGNGAATVSQPYMRLRPVRCG